jgi:hypothetical protein
MTYNRRVKRLRADWDGICHIEGEPDDRKCRVVDISMHGLGITLEHPSPTELAGRNISVDVPAVAQIQGQITHAELILGGAIRIGVMLNEHASAEVNSSSHATMVERNRT